MVYSTKRLVLCLTLCYFVLLFFNPFSIAITSLGEERANLSAFRTFVPFVLVSVCWLPLPLGVWEGRSLDFSLILFRDYQRMKDCPQLFVIYRVLKFSAGHKETDGSDVFCF